MTYSIDEDHLHDGDFLMESEVVPGVIQIATMTLKRPWNMVIRNEKGVETLA